MTVKEFVTKYKEAKTSAVKDALIKKLNIKDYIDVNTKSTYINLVVSKANAEYDKDGNIIGHRYNSIMQHVLFTVTMIQLYTDLDIDFKREENPDNVLEIYDLLNQSDLLSKIFDLIGEKEIDECMLFLTMASNDFTQNVMSLQAYIGDKIDRATDVINAAVDFASNENNNKNSDVNELDFKEV